MDRDSDSNAGKLPTLVNRRTEYAAVTDGLVHRSEPALYLYGPKGTGKTLLTRHAVRELSDHTSVRYLSCIHHNTQYKVLSALCAAITGGDFTTGYHTAQLYAALIHALADQDLVIILDDIDFLLLNDGGDLLYALSRLKQHKPQLVLVSATHPELATELDERTYSSLLPYTVYLEPYTVEETIQILERRGHDWLDQEVTSDAVAHIAATTPNIQVGYHWLTVAAEVTDSPITEEVIRLVREDAVQRYRARQLASFSEHHWLLLDAVELLTADTASVRSGAVYDCYQEICAQTGTTPLSTRRISDFLKHLELLQLIRAEYRYGGRDGKTRRIWLQPLC